MQNAGEIELGDKNYAILDRHAQSYYVGRNLEKYDLPKIKLFLPLDSMMDGIQKDNLLDIQIDVAYRRYSEKNVNKNMKKEG